MRTRRIIAISAGVFVLLIAVAVMAFSEPARISISITPKYYFVSAGQIFSSIVVTNTSNVEIICAESHASELRVFDENGWKQAQVSDVAFSNPKVFDVGATATTLVQLSPNVRKWQIAYDVQTPSLQLKLWRILPPKVTTRIWRTVAKVVSEKPGKVKRIWSEEIDIRKWREDHQEELDRAKLLRRETSKGPPWL